MTTLSISAADAARLGAGAVITQQASEALRCAKPCAIDHYPQQSAAEVLTYVSSGSGAIDFTPQFVQLGFRYIQLNVTGGHAGSAAAFRPGNGTLSMRFVRTSAAEVGDIRFSDELLNQIQRAARCCSVVDHLSRVV